MSLNIGIIMGGYSKEFDISLKTGEVVYNVLSNKFNCFKIHILKNEWFYIDNINQKFELNKKDFSIINKPEIKFDCIFNAIHGSPGEDGIMQKYFSKLNIPITGCDTEQSELTFDKIKCLEFLKKNGIKTSNSLVINNETNINPTYNTKETSCAYIFIIFPSLKPLYSCLSL